MRFEFFTSVDEDQVALVWHAPTSEFVVLKIIVKNPSTKYVRDFILKMDLA